MTATIALAIALESFLLHSRGWVAFAIPLLIVVASALPYAIRRFPLGATMGLLVFQTATLFHPSFGSTADQILESRVVFLGLILIYICILIFPRALRQSDRRMFSTAVLLAFLLLYAAGAVILARSEKPELSGANSIGAVSTPSAGFPDSVK